MKVTIPGAEQVMERMRLAVVSKAKKGIRKGSRAGAKVVQARAKALAPKRSGLTQRSIKVRALARSRVRMGASCTLHVAEGAFYAAFVDLGTRFTTGRRFMKRAAEETADEAGRTFVDGILAELT